MNKNNHNRKVQLQIIKLEMQERKKKVNWTKEEDMLLIKAVGDYNKRPSWKEVAKVVKTRTSKQCKQRYINNLMSNIKKGNWTKEEDEQLLSLQKQYGNQWAVISKIMVGRSPNTLKNRYFGHFIRTNNISNSDESIKKSEEIASFKSAFKTVDPSLYEVI